jgi:hypothetical protein
MATRRRIVCAPPLGPQPPRSVFLGFGVPALAHSPLERRSGAPGGSCGSPEGTPTLRVLLRCRHHSSILIPHSSFLGVTRPAEQRAKMPRQRGLQPRRQRRRQHLSSETLQHLSATAAWHVVAAARQVVGELLPRWTA